MKSSWTCLEMRKENPIDCNCVYFEPREVAIIRGTNNIKFEHFASVKATWHVIQER
jgi:hypothetical protein